MSKVYVCPDCDRTFFGVTNRRARRPLDQQAVARANRCSVDHCPPTRVTGSDQPRRLTLQSSEYLCRRVWMDCYLKALDEEPEKIVPKEETRPDEPVQPCKKPVDPALKCVVLCILALCEHKDNGIRSAENGETLEVVPDANYSADTIELEATGQKLCGEHPRWEITDQEPRQGLKSRFEAHAPVTSKLWIPRFSPREYDVTVEGCNGEAGELAIHVYPGNELSGNIDLKKSLEVIKKITDGLEMVLDTVADRFQWKYLEGKVSAQAAWKEYTDHRAYYAYNIAVKLDPLFGAEFKVTIGPGKITKLAGKIPGIGKYIKKVVEWLVKAGLFFKLNGGITIDVKWERDKPELPTFVAGIGSGIAGQVLGGLGLEGAIVDDLIKVELEATGAIKAGGAPFIDEKGFGLGKFRVDFDGLKGNCKLIFLWGIVDVNETVTFMGSQNIYGPTQLYFYEA